jgi:hypothetical protein
LGLAASAAYYSIHGLSSLFAGAKFEVMIMASVLEYSKLVVASYLHNNWNHIGFLLKTYLTSGIIILMVITSAGIYGFLTAAYQKTSDELLSIEKQIEFIDFKKQNYVNQLEYYNDEKNNLVNSINSLRGGLANNVIQYKDNDGNIISTTSSANRKSLENQLELAMVNLDKINNQISSVNDSIVSYELNILDIKNNNTVAGEIGPLRYLSKLLDKPMDTIVNYFTLLIVFVFDPLAIALVIALNKYIELNSKPTNKPPLQKKETSDDNNGDNINNDENSIEHKTEVQKFYREIPKPTPNAVKIYTDGVNQKK